MVVAIAIWSTVLEQGKKHVVVPQCDLRITNAALGEKLADESGRTSVKFTYQTPIDLDEEDDEDVAPPPQSVTILCSLTPGKIEQSGVDLILERDEEYVFEIVGKNTVYLTGNYIDQMPPDEPPFGIDSDDESEDDDYEGAFNLEDVSSDVEVEADDLELDDDAERFEEVNDEAMPKPLKRPRESDAMETDAKPEEEKLSKSAKKKLNKKLKAEDGKVVATGVEGKVEKVEDKAEKRHKDKPKKVEKKDENPAGATQVLASGLKIKDVKTGEGKAAKSGDRVGMRYVGKLTNGNVFDKNVKGKAFAFRLGQGEVIKGWDLGIVGMKVGGERELTIPAKLAYGNQKMDGIPANSTLVFEVKLLELK